MYVCMFVCVYVCMSLYLSVCMYMHICMHACMCVCVLSACMCYAAVYLQSLVGGKQECGLGRGEKASMQPQGGAVGTSRGYGQGHVLVIV